MELFEEVRDRWRRTFRHVLVDEYQDTNHAHYRMLQLDRKSRRLNSSHTEIYTLSLHDALPIYGALRGGPRPLAPHLPPRPRRRVPGHQPRPIPDAAARSEEQTSELQSHRDLHSFPTRRSSDLWSSSRRSATAGAAPSATSSSTSTRTPTTPNTGCCS